MTRLEGLGRRERAVLRAVIRAHLQTGEPVSSQAVSRDARVGVAPATVRAIMAELEARELLRQPHPSAGRVPTDLAYRVYVERWMSPPRLSRVQAERIDAALARARGEIPELLEEASRQLSHLSRQVGVVLAPELSRVVVEQIELVRVAPRRAVAILVSRSGVVHSRLVELDEELPPRELERIGAYLAQRYGGRTLPQMRADLLRDLDEAQAAYERHVARSLELGRRLLAGEAFEPEVFVGGASNLVGRPEFSDRERMQALLRTLEEKSRLVALLERLLESRGVQVLIGRENPDPELADCTLVASAYGFGERRMGTVAVVGPLRMPYRRAVAAVQYLADALTRMLSSPEAEG